ncbi:hypothetical protein A2303_03225 [Candidatus Falkowbacteria bacterium RIFOXYB2_FULL_47_14]|uniref:Uncharacterized protein n=1 Tax=Candidatus Falkowbacteria bacterium RIFOXYA2_FULL_47_19 TaxID=1797994 RepID=A0A1F5SF06_9BACT|nr:MAG: hypothetical protein A2227_07750 [Candidatus Falkowbacteria bacterium RIFOXYA2_FULL_47_19]OGF35198.1 MAG: hypothetical protein A2468_02060 [Candidatus Falkowbacteria bacterium RIFOXYC2_FULL_46_15]OGF43363.1 MAG: hypothetical protein A2303_03225 [Candidatus Falkowbacteria bacterium RIFOXYB2_FULL_47_14]
MKKASRTKKYIITAAQGCYCENKDGNLEPFGGGRAKALPHENFIAGLETIAGERGAETIIQPIAGKNKRESFLHESLQERNDIFWGELKILNRNIQLRNIVVPAQNVDPTTGKKTLVSKYGSSLVFAHSKQRYLPVPVFNADLPRYIYTTGACTLPNYDVSNHRGDTAERTHVIGALIVEIVDESCYNVRNLRALKNGKFVDLGWEYDGDKAPRRIGVDSLVLGDTHWGDHDPETNRANYEMIKYFRPRRIFLHDFFNGSSVNHHQKDNYLEKIREYNRGRLFLDTELKEDRKELIRLSRAAGSKTQIFVVSSNHAQFLPTYINSDAWRKNNLWNADIGAYLFQKGITLAQEEKDIDDASYLIEEGMKRHGPIPANVQFLRLKDNMRRHGYQLASHGHKGSHGSRGGGAKAREITGGGKSITAHSHCMEIYGDTNIVGTSSQLNLPYTLGGGSAWIAANAVLYDNGIVQMIPIINGHWRLQGKYL